MDLADGALNSFNLLRIFVLLVINDRFFEALPQIDTVEAMLPAQMVLIQENIRPIEGLPVNQFAQVQQKRVASDIIQPINHHQVIPAALFAPIGPMPQRRLR